MARCDTCPQARWEEGYDTEVWCEKKKRYIKVGRTRHLFAAAERLQQEATPPNTLKQHIRL